MSIMQSHASVKGLLFESIPESESPQKYDITFEQRQLSDSDSDSVACTDVLLSLAPCPTNMIDSNSDSDACTEVLLSLAPCPTNMIDSDSDSDACTVVWLSLAPANRIDSDSDAVLMFCCLMLLQIVCMIHER